MATEGGKIVHDPEAQAINEIAKAMAKLTDPDSKEAVIAWFKRKYVKAETPK